MPGVDRNVDVDTALAELMQRVVKRFADEVPREIVEETVVACGVRFRDARIVAFVPLLTERLCVERLHDVANGTTQRDVTERARSVS